MTATVLHRSSDPFSCLHMDMMRSFGQPQPTRDGSARYNSSDSFIPNSVIEYASHTEPFWDMHSAASEGGLQNTPHDSNFLGGYSNGQDYFRGPTPGSVSHSIDTRVLSPASVTSSRRSPLLAHSGSRPGLVRVASQISATDSTTSLRPARSIYSEPVELRMSISQRSHPFPSGASDVTDHTIVSLPDIAYISSTPQYMDDRTQSELNFHVTDDAEIGYPSFNGIPLGNQSESRSVPLSLDSSFFQTADSYGLASPQEMYSSEMATSKEPNQVRNGTSMSHGDDCQNPYGPPFVFDTFQVHSPHDFSATEMWQEPYQISGPTGFDHNNVIGSPSSVHTHQDLTPRQQHFQQGSSYSGMPEGSSPSSNASQENSLEAEKLHNTYRSDPLYKSAVLAEDGLYHCPFESKDASCTHKPDKLKCNYDKFVDSHLKPYRCKHRGCEASRFSSTACQLRHEREAHALHGHGEKPYLCTFEGCDRATVGNGFPRHWNMFDHMKRVHGYEKPSTPSGEMSAKGSRKRKAEATDMKPAKKVAVGAVPPKSKLEEAKENVPAPLLAVENKVSQEAEVTHQQLILGAMTLPKPDHPDFQKRLQMVARCLKNLHNVTQLEGGEKAKGGQSG